MISKQELMHKLVQALFESTTRAVNEALQELDEDDTVNMDEIFADVGALTMTTGAVVLLDKLGREAAALAARRLADKIEKGDLDNLSGYTPTTWQ